MIPPILGVLLLSGVAQAATLGIPTPHTTLSGIGVVSGWKCEAGELTLRFDGGPPIPLVYGSGRRDVLDAGACDQAEVGFVTIMNWGELGDGTHTAVVYHDGVEFDRSTFDVVTTGEAFLRGAAGQCVVEDFPAPNENARFIWNQPTQHMELAEVGGAELLPSVEECEETRCPVCEVCRTCPEIPADPLRHIYGNWNVTFRFTYDGCPYSDFSTPFSLSSPTLVDSNGSRVILNKDGYVEGAIASRPGRRDISVSGRLYSSSGSGTWFNNLAE